jgi:hypothetical protein
MPVQCPPCQWPATFEECGPDGDPSILLAGTARIGESRVRIIAIRTSPASRRIPDYRNDVPRECYETNRLNVVLETVLDNFEGLAGDFSDLLGEDGSEIVKFATGSYLVAALSVPAAPA